MRSLSRSSTSVSLRFYLALDRLARFVAGPPEFLADERGAIPVEYIAVFAFVTVGMTIALVKLGPSLMAGWGVTQDVLLKNKP